MHAVVIVRKWLRGGGERIAISTIELLNEMGFNVKVYSESQPNTEEIEDKYGKRIVIESFTKLDIPNVQGRFLIYKRNKVHKLECDGDLCVVTTGEHFITPNKEMPLVVHFNGFPVLSEKHFSFPWNIYTAPFKKRIQNIMHLLAKRGTIIVNSEFTKHLINQLVDDIQLQIIYPPVDVDRFRYTGKKDKELIVSVGRIARSKNFDNAIEVARRTGLKLTIVGFSEDSVYEQELHTLINKLNLTDRVNMITDPTYDDLAAAVKRAGIFLSSISTEYFGIATVEAMSAGCITLVRNSGAQTDYVPAKWRYYNIDDCVLKIKQAVNASESERNELITISEKYHERNFKQKMRGVLEWEIMNRRPD